MKLLDKLKNAIFEEVEEEETKVVPEVKEEKIVKKIDVEKTIQEAPKQESLVPKVEEKRVDHIKKPIIFDDEDFLSETRELSLKRSEAPKVKEKPLYGGYGLKDEKSKEKFKPSPIISPVYGLVHDESSSSYEVNGNKVALDTLLKEEKKKPEVTFDTVRQKAFGVTEEKKEVEKSLLYEMKQDEDVPGIEKVTLGDAEEYFNDLGLEYEVDYKDAAKSNMTRSTKNKELSEIVDEEIKGDAVIAEELAKKKTTKKSSKISKLDEAKSMTDANEADEKNLYDLIDMMYDSKE